MNKLQNTIRERIETNLTINNRINKLRNRIYNKTVFFWTTITENINTFNQEGKTEGVSLKIRDTHHNPETGKAVIDTITVSYEGITYIISPKEIVSVESSHGNPKPEDYQNLYDIIVALSQSYRALD